MWCNTKCLMTIVILNLILSGCSSNKDMIYDDLPSDIYESARQKLQNSDYKDAIKYLEELDNFYPFGPYTQQVQLDLIYAYYKYSEFLLAKNLVDRFLWLNPTHLNVDYVLYMRGLVNMALDDNILQRFCGIDRSDRNTEYALDAFHNFVLLIRTYPNSKYATDAHKRLIYLKNRLAKHDLSIVKYYNERGAYVAVINRVEQMLYDFPDTHATCQALPYMERAYRQLCLNEQADKVAKIIAANL